MSKTQEEMDREAAHIISQEAGARENSTEQQILKTGIMLGITYGRENPTPFDFKKAIESLDGVAAVNLAEPSPGDLERVVNAYRAERAKTAKVREALEFYGDETKYFMGKSKINFQKTTAVFKVDDPSKLPTDHESEVYECSVRIKMDQGNVARYALALLDKGESDTIQVPRDLWEKVNLLIEDYIEVQESLGGSYSCDEHKEVAEAIKKAGL